VKLAGIDYSTHVIDIVFLDADRELGELPWWVHYDLPGTGDAFARTLEVANVLPARRSSVWDEVYAVALEEPYQKGPAARSFVPKLKAVQGAILSCLPPALEVRAYGAPTWRSLVGIPGGASKDEVREWVMAELGTDPPWPQDACDAYCIARALELEVINQEVRT
jgi:hypothetical protein